MRKIPVAAVMAALLCAALAARAAPAPSKEDAAAANRSRVLTIKPAQIQSVALHSDGKTPAATVPARIWSIAKKKFVHEATTDEDGACALPKLPEGRYIGIFGDRLRLDIVVDEAKGQATEKLKVVIPRGKSQVTRKKLATELARVGPSFAAGGQAGAGLRSWLSNPWITAGVVATAIAVPVALHNRGSSTGGDDDDEPTRRRRRRRRVVSP